MSGEFQLIERHFSGWPIDKAQIKLGVGDDCALLNLGAEEELAVSVDTMVAGVHFLPHTPPAIVGYRALAVSISDLAAMGASPFAFTLALTLPKNDDVWLAEFSRGLFHAASLFGISLIGGDTTRGPLSISIQVMGRGVSGCAVTRASAKPGDEVFVSGYLGGAGVGLAQAKQHPDLRSLSLRELINNADCPLSRFLVPSPRLALGECLAGQASSCIDISDGLVGDLGHILAASECSASIRLDRLPVSQEVRDFAGDDWWRHALSFGDDYELCFTASPEQWLSLSESSRFKAISSEIPISKVGVITEGSGLKLLDDSGVELELVSGAFSHF